MILILCILAATVAGVIALLIHWAKRETPPDNGVMLQAVLPDRDFEPDFEPDFVPDFANLSIVRLYIKHGAELEIAQFSNVENAAAAKIARSIGRPGLIVIDRNFIDSASVTRAIVIPM